MTGSVGGPLGRGGEPAPEGTGIKVRSHREGVHVKVPKVRHFHEGRAERTSHEAALVFHKRALGALKQ
jgi:hypothetical protein